MASTSSPLPYLPLEVKNHILRFCTPSTLAKTAQVSLALLELSSPIFYEDVHIHRFEGFKLLFCSRSQPPTLQTAPFLSLSQIRDLSLDYSFDDLEEYDYSSLVLEREPSNSPLALSSLRISITSLSLLATDPSPPLDVSLLEDLLTPKHLIVEAASTSRAGILFPSSTFPSLETIFLASVRVMATALGETVEGEGKLRRVTFDLPEREDGYFEDLVESMVVDFPFPEAIDIAILVRGEEEKEYVLDELRLEAGSDSRYAERLLAQVRVEIK